MPRREPMKVRTVRAGPEWDAATKIAKARGVDLSSVVRELLEMYVKLAGPETTPTD